MKEIFVYYGAFQKVPKDVGRVRVHSSVKVIERKAFEGCQKLKYVQFGEGVEDIGDDAFRGCISLETVRMAPTTRYIANSAFRSCRKLRYVILNEGLYMIGRFAFDGCESMEFLALPSTTRYIQGRAFRNCQNLKEVLLNEGLLYVGTHAFESCTNLKAVIVPASNGITFGVGSKKWIRQWPVKDERFWNRFSSNANLADKGIMAHLGMLVPTDVAQVQTVVAELETRLAQSKQYEQGLVASLESWKKTYSALSQGNQCNSSSLQAATPGSYQVEPMEVDDDMSHWLNAMTIHSASKMMGQPTTLAAAQNRPSVLNDKSNHQPQQHHRHQQQPVKQDLCIYQGNGTASHAAGQQGMVTTNSDRTVPPATLPAARPRNESSPPTAYRTELKVNLDNYLKISSCSRTGGAGGQENFPHSQSNSDGKATDKAMATMVVNPLKKRKVTMQDSTNHQQNLWQNDLKKIMSWL